MKNALIRCLFLLSLFFGPRIVNATTLVAGDFETRQSGGVWAQDNNKFFLFYDINNHTGFDKTPIDSFSAITSILVGAKAPTHIALRGMGTGKRDGTSDLTVAEFAMYSGSTLLLSATLGRNDGTLTYINRLGTAGNFDFSSDMTVTGGSLFTAGLVKGIIDVNVTGDNGYYARRDDFLFSDISFLVGYTPINAPNAIPEPATSLLLISSLAGVVVKRKRAKAIEA